MNPNQKQIIDFLPSLFRRQVEEQSDGFLAKYLQIFEALLINDNTGVWDQQSIKEILRYAHNMVDPAAPWLYDSGFSDYLSVNQEEFLGWMAGWFAFVLDTDWSTTKKQEVLSNIIPLYRIRGTKKGLEEYLKIAVPGGSEGIEILDNIAPFQVGDPDPNIPLDKQSAQLGVNSVVGGMVGHYFIVYIKMVAEDIAMIPYKKKIVYKIIDMEKPVHTHYDVEFVAPKLQVDIQSQVGVDTLI